MVFRLGLGLEQTTSAPFLTVYVYTIRPAAAKECMASIVKGLVQIERNMEQLVYILIKMGVV